MMISAIIKQQQPDWSVLEASNSDEALAIISEQVIDYFSVDLNMPGQDGLELITSLKKSLPESKFALLTANIQEHTHKSAEDLGAACINKPITEASISQMLDYFND